jgi:hypothetical protein
MRAARRHRVLLFLLVLMAPALCSAQVWHDPFNYADGTAGEPAWTPDSVSWLVASGRLTFDGGAKSFITFAQAPEGRSVSIEALVQVGARRGEGWGLAGVVVRHDDANYWHLALIAAPAAKEAATTWNWPRTTMGSGTPRAAAQPPCA